MSEKSTDLSKGIARAILELQELVPGARIIPGVEEEGDFPSYDANLAGGVTVDMPPEASFLYDNKQGKVIDAYLPPTEKPQEARIPAYLMTVPLKLSPNIKSFAVEVEPDTHITFDVGKGTVRVDGESNYYWAQMARSLARKYKLEYDMSEEETHPLEDDARSIALRAVLKSKA